MAQRFIVKEKRVDNQKSKPAKGKGMMIERLPVRDEKRNRTARDRGEQLLGMQRVQKNIFLWKSREEKIPRRAWLIVSQIPRIRLKNHTWLQELCGFVRNTLISRGLHSGHMEAERKKLSNQSRWE